MRNTRRAVVAPVVVLIFATGLAIPAEATTTSKSSGPDLSIAIAGRPNPDTVGQDLTYGITVYNNGPGTATGVTVTDTIPAGLTLVQADSACTGTTTLTCNVGTVWSTAGFDIVVRPTATGTFTDTASVSGSQRDPVPGNNSSSTTTTVNPPPSYPLALGRCSGVARAGQATSCGTTFYVPSPSTVTLTFTPGTGTDAFIGNFAVRLDGGGYPTEFSGVAAGEPASATTWLTTGMWSMAVDTGGTLTHVGVNIPPRQVCTPRGPCFFVPGVSTPPEPVPGAAIGSFSASAIATGPA